MMMAGQQLTINDENSYCSLMECYECMNENSISIYASVEGGGEDIHRYPPPPNNFGLSKRGLLQIDYSFNWNNLYRFITK